MFVSKRQRILLDSDVLDDADVRQILENPENYIDSEQYFSWERFFTNLLIEKSADTYLKYNKSTLNDNYLQKKIVQKIVGDLPKAIKDTLNLSENI